MCLQPVGGSVVKRRREAIRRWAKKPISTVSVIVGTALLPFYVLASPIILRSYWQYIQADRAIRERLRKTRNSPPRANW